MSRDQIEEEIASAHSGLTALPRLESIYSPKRTHTRHGSEDPVLEKGFFAKEIEAGDRSGAVTPAEYKKENWRNWRSWRSWRPSKRTIWIIAGAVALLILVIILGAVLGTFVGSKHESAPQPSVTQIPAGTTPTPTAMPTSGIISPTSTAIPGHIGSLTVTGWSDPTSPDQYTVWLFSQDSDGYLSRHSYDSNTGNWTRVSNFVAAKPGTPLAASSLNTAYYSGQSSYDFVNTKYQTQVVYLNSDNYVNEWIFPDNGPELGQPGSLTQQMYIAHPETQLTSYWPSLIYQGMSGEVREAQFECYEKDQCWNDNVLGTSEARNGTQLVTAPTGNNLSTTVLFYREEGGRFVDYIQSTGDPQLRVNDAFADLVPTDTKVTAFSTTRPGDAQALNTYLLWQNASGTIQVSWSDNDNGWRAPVTYQAFNGAGNNTAIACLTGMTFAGFPLADGTELSRCYFQAGDAIREVSFDGTTWNVVGNVPTFGF